MQKVRRLACRRLARTASGRESVDGDDRAVALVGAGALGSQLALCASRMGIRIPQSRIGTLASISVERVFGADRAEGTIEVWRLSEDGIGAIRLTPSAYCEVSIAGYAGSISVQAVEAMIAARSMAADQETGGILVGAWDRARNAFYVVAALDAPPDSVATRTGFVRGCAGFYQTIDDIECHTAANLTYVGEWHSHPPGCGTAPSSDDRVLLEWISDVLAFADVPLCMAIVGEEGVRIVLGTHVQTELLCESAWGPGA